jgi:hypothetical protein
MKTTNFLYHGNILSSCNMASETAFLVFYRFKAMNKEEEEAERTLAPIFIS